MTALRVGFLVAASVGAMFPWKRWPPWAAPAVLATIALACHIVPIAAARRAGDDLAGAIAFLLVAVPLAVLLDESGFFAALAEVVDRGRHLRAGLWVLAAVVTIVFNLDAAVVLLTPLYVRLAERRGEDPVALGLIPALLASLASSVLPVSNLTNLVAAERLHIGTLAFVGHLGLPSIAAIAVGGWMFSRQRHPPQIATVPGAASSPGRDALWVGGPVVIWLLLGFTLGERLGVPAWAVAGLALVGLVIRQRALPWRHVPYGAALLAGGLGVLATAVAGDLPVERLLAVSGVPGELATIAVTALGSNAINNLPALLVTLPALDQHQDRVWAVLLGTNLGPTLWVTGALSTLLWQATMRRLGHSVSALRYARTAAVVGLPAIAAAATVHVALVVVAR